MRAALSFLSTQGAGLQPEMGFPAPREGSSALELLGEPFVSPKSLCIWILRVQFFGTGCIQGPTDQAVFFDDRYCYFSFLWPGPQSIESLLGRRRRLRYVEHVMSKRTGTDGYVPMLHIPKPHAPTWALCPRYSVLPAQSAPQSVRLEADWGCSSLFKRVKMCVAPRPASRSAHISRTRS